MDKVRHNISKTIYPAGYNFENIRKDFKLISSEIIEKPEVKDEFIVDKWYKVKWSNQIQKMYIKPTDFPDKKHVNCKGPNSIWLDSGIPYINKESTYVVSDLSEIELLTDLSEIQQYLPDGHVDKIVTPKFEVGKWYKCSLNSNLYQFDGFITDKKWGSSAKINPLNCEHGNVKPGYTKTTCHAAYIEYFSPTSLADMEIVNKFLPKVEEKWIPKIDDWVTVLKWSYAKIDLSQTCKIQSINLSSITPFGIKLQKDQYGKSDEIWYFKRDDFRKATQEEIESVTKTKEKVYDYEVVHCVNEQEWEFVSSKTTTDYSCNWTVCKLEYPNEEIALRTKGEGWARLSFYNSQNSKIYTFKEWCDKFNHKPDFGKPVPKYEALVTINPTIVSPEYPLTPDDSYTVGIDPYYEEPNIQKVFIEDEDLFETKVTKTKTITTDLISQEQETYY